MLWGRGSIGTCCGGGALLGHVVGEGLYWDMLWGRGSIGAGYGGGALLGHVGEGHFWGRLWERGSIGTGHGERALLGHDVGGGDLLGHGVGKGEELYGDMLLGRGRSSVWVGGSRTVSKEERRREEDIRRGYRSK